MTSSRLTFLSKTLMGNPFSKSVKLLLRGEGEGRNPFVPKEEVVEFNMVDEEEEELLEISFLDVTVLLDAS